MPTLVETVAVYQNLLLAQYRNASRARANIGIYVKQALGDMLISEIGDGFDLDTAMGAQLDIIGKYVGVSRNIGPPADTPYYGFSGYDGSLQPNGFTDYLLPAMNAQAIWYQYQFNGNENTALPDDQFRFVLQWKIILNSNPSTLASIMAYLKLFFDGVVSLTDNADMSLTYVLTTRPPVDPSVFKPFLPKPMGVGVTFEYLTAVASPGAIYYSVGSPSEHEFVVAPTPSVVTPTNGTAPYSYQWQRISETNPGDFGYTGAITPEAASTQFERAFNLYGVASSKWICNVRDANGLVCQTNEVTVNLSLGPP